MTINALVSTVAGIVVWLTFHSLGDSTGEAASVAVGALELWTALFSNAMLLVSMVSRRLYVFTCLSRVVHSEPFYCTDLFDLTYKV